MSEVGYYRYKTTADVYKQIHFEINGTYVPAKYVSPIVACSGSLIVKYIDRAGQYRFYPFSKYYQTSDEPELIGTANKFITNILSDQTDKQNIGFKNQRRMEISAEVPNDQLEKLIDIYTSPRVYIYIGDGTDDAAKDWLEVNQIIGTPIVKRRKGNMGKIIITLELPENYSVTMI